MDFDVIKIKNKKYNIVGTLPKSNRLIEETETKSIPSILTYVINRNYSTILATLQITSYALGV